MPKSELSIFFAWQSDSASATNKSAILRALTNATAEVEAERPGTIIKIDQATRDMMGSGNVPDSIREKIEAADMFVGDVTIVTPPAQSDEKIRPCPNPNVTFEVGYAVAHLGWKRCTLVLNTALAQFEDLPFDFDRQRCTGFRVTDGKDAGGIKRLMSDLKLWILQVVDNDPDRPASMRGVDPAPKRRSRDLLAAEAALSQFSTTALQTYIEDLPRSFSEHDFDFFYSFAGTVRSVLFHINDPALLGAFQGLYTAWDQALSQAAFYRNAGERYVFSNSWDAPLSETQEAGWNVVEAATHAMRHHLADLLRIIREDYVEIDLVKTNSAALQQWRREKAAAEELLRDPE